MGLTRQYLRYAASAIFGVVAGLKCNVCYVALRGEKGRYVAVGACEHVFIWDTRKGEKVLILQGQRQEVTQLRPSPDGLALAVGYEDGSIRIFSLLSGESGVTFNGHKAAVTALTYDPLGGRLVSGSKDTDVIVWDVINECGLYRLKGHKDAVTQALILSDRNLLVTSGKDTLVKWWDLDTQHCFRTMVGHRTEVRAVNNGGPCLQITGVVLGMSCDSHGSRRGVVNGTSVAECEAGLDGGVVVAGPFVPQDPFSTVSTVAVQPDADATVVCRGRHMVWGLALLEDERRILTGSADSELRAWTVSYVRETGDSDEPQLKKAKGPAEEAGSEEAEEEAQEERILTCQRYGSIMREGRDRVVTLAVDRTRRFLACHGMDSMLEVFCVLNKEEIAKKMERKLKKAKKKTK
ncbi:unnamed protein product [Ranitomeya imitator]|uniref:WD repeat domain 3 n=1 Tax=Ranitomeya imitator TaxID=111125 RepID=A0ABN9LVG8_9NEOB|nr:unnamed protein product [Ranitomeya imitator]